jgi:hypothetical protein
LCLTLRGQLYTESLIGRGDISVEEAERAQGLLQPAGARVQRGSRAGARPPAPSPSVEQEQSVPVDLDTSVPLEVVHRIGDVHGLWVPETVLTPLTGHLSPDRTGRDPLVAIQLIYVTFGKLLAWMVLRTRSDTTKEIEILVLRHQLAVLQRRTPRRGFAGPTAQ